MKSTTVIGSVLLATLSLLSTSSAHMAISNPPAQAGPWSKNPSGAVHAWIGYEGKKFPCGKSPPFRHVISQETKQAASRPARPPLGLPAPE